MAMSRRGFMQAMGMGSAAFMLQNSMARPLLAAPSEVGAIPHNFVFCYFSGGWDTLMCLDPRDPGEFNDSRLQQTRIEPAYNRLPEGFARGVIHPDGAPDEMIFGPAMEKFARASFEDGTGLWEKSCIIRGVSMDTLTHVVGRRYFLTGKMPRGRVARGSSMTTRIVAQQGELSAMPNLVARVEGYNQDHNAFASPVSVNSVGDLLGVLKDGRGAASDVVRARLDAYRNGTAFCDPGGNDRRGFLSLLRSTQNDARELVTGGMSGRFSFTNGSDPEMVALKERYGIDNLGSVPAQAAMAYQALKYGIAQTVTIQLASGLDTHDGSWAEGHSTRLRGGFDALTTLVQDLGNTTHPMAVDGSSLLDHTTIVCFSEFSRTSKINARGGRDHALGNSVLLVGGGAPGGKVVGATSNSGMNPRAIDPETGRPTNRGTTITPPLIHASLLANAGLSPFELRVEGLPCLMTT